MTPEEIAERQFTRARRGYDRDEVRAFLASVAAHLVEIQAVAEATSETPRPAPPASPSGDADTAAQTGRDVASIMRSAEEWSARVRTEAEKEADAIRDAARAEAEALEASADEASANARQLLADAEGMQAEVTESLEAERLALEEKSSARMSEAERKAERILEEARAEAEAITRSAEDEATTRSTEILAGAQSRLDTLLGAQTRVQSRLQLALDEVRATVEKVGVAATTPSPRIEEDENGDENAEIDLTEPAGSSDADRGDAESPSGETDIAEQGDDDDATSDDDESGDRLSAVVRDAVSRALKER